ncbi:NAD-dependent epimerase/dehydratase family protein [Massiliimalia massiliensis]|uniref:NAD-dependent epimerase/dehydratase family protein n=1 Tax=Massiliimalia massiliensis TaxID=1852384 RepID=UPI000985F467|nr:NAD-dependent epimerase/dehydratase family protein [Massiliimalia massiliensis]
MKAVVIGAYGHIGTYLVPMLIEQGYEVLAVSRGISKPYEENPLWEQAVKVKLDRTKAPGFSQAIADMQAEVVIDLINFDIRESQAMVRALKGTNCTHYLYCSSCWAHGRAGLLPVNSDDMLNTPLCAYGKDKLASENYLRDEYEENGFPATCIRPGQISGPGWAIIGPWGNASLTPFQKIADGEQIMLPNFGMETIHHVHGYDVAQCFAKAVLHRDKALGEIFEAASGNSITLYGYAKLMYDFFGKEARIGFLPWKEWCEYEGNPEECESTYLHIARSGFYSIERERKLLGYQPKYTNVETIKLAVQSYLDRGLIKVK